MKARKKPIEVFAIKIRQQYHFGRIFKTSKEPIKKNPFGMMNRMEQFTLSKNEVRLLYQKAIGSSVKTIPTVVFGR